MKLAFYKAEFGDWSDKLISWYTNGPFSHVEMYFSNGECFSSSPRDGGTRWKVISDIEISGKWLFIDIPNIDETALRYLCNKQLGKKYDWLCIFLCDIIPFDIQDPKKWVCSEICAKLVLNLHHAFKYSPNSLFRRLSCPT